MHSIMKQLPSLHYVIINALRWKIVVMNRLVHQSTASIDIIAR